jgi:LDH2 family malate/lactate/ureidoglycolate dehydrogenase
MIVLQADQLRTIANAIFQAAGAPPGVATQVADSLVESNLRGYDSHGVMRVLEYVRQIRSGDLKPDASMRIVRETPATALVDGGWNFGQVVGRYAMQVALDKARSGSLGAVGAVRCNHVGRLGEYAAMAAEQGMIGLALANVVPVGTPFGGKGRAMGTNPIAFAVPAGQHPMVVADISTTVLAEGKVRVARDKHEQLPLGCILDKDGKPTTDPNDFYAGGMLQYFGGHKGYALAILVETLAGAMTGAFSYTDRGKGHGVFMLAISPSGFDEPAAVQERVDRLFGRIKGVPPAPGFREVLLPGENGTATKRARLIEGVVLPNDTWEALKKLAADLDLNVEAVVARPRSVGAEDEPPWGAGIPRGALRPAGNGGYGHEKDEGNSGTVRSGGLPDGPPGHQYGRRGPRLPHQADQHDRSLATRDVRGPNRPRHRPARQQEPRPARRRPQ